MTLDEAVDRALMNNKSLKAAAFDTTAVVFDNYRARSYRYPSLSINSKARFISELQSITTSLFSKEIGSKEQYQTDVTLSVPIFTGGKISSRIRMTKEQLAASRLQFSTIRLQTIHVSKDVYYQLMAADVSVKATEASMVRLDIIRQNVENLYQSGLADSLDILETMLAYETGSRSLSDMKTNFINASDVLKNVIGETNLSIEIVPSKALEIPTKPAYSSQTLSGVAGRPELSRLVHVIKAADEAASERRAAYFPNISGFAGYSYGMPNQDMFNKSWNDYFSAGISLNWSFNLGRETSYAVKSARAKASSLEMSYRAMEEALVLKAKIAYNNTLKSFSSYEIVQRELQFARRKYALAQQKQKEGNLSVNRLLEMEAELTTAEKRYEASIISFYRAENDFLYAIGSDKTTGVTP